METPQSAPGAPAARGSDVAALGAVLTMLAVAAGAFGAHALRSRLGEMQLEIFQTAARYHLVHAVALVAIGLATPAWPRKNFAPAAWLMAIGIVLFSGSLYALALGAPGWSGIITPLGGLAFIVAWLMLALTLMRRDA